MPELLPIAEMEIDRATSRLETTKLNPTKIYAIDTSRGSAFYFWQNGHWFGTGGNYLEDKDVPQEFRDHLAEHPPTTGVLTGPAIVKVCKFCGDEMNASVLDDHYIAHVNAAMKLAGTTAPVPELDPPAKQTITPKHDANQHRRG